jgi:hypothetical protein
MEHLSRRRFLLVLANPQSRRKVRSAAFLDAA